MIVIRTVCPACPKESKKVVDAQNLHHYKDVLVYLKCKHHPVTPEDRLVAAIFGRR